MRSAARLTYEEIQAAQEGRGEAHRRHVPQEALDALYGAFAALAAARAGRGALELDISEHRVVLDAEARPVAIVPYARLDSHRLIEEFMILANVAAAEELEARRSTLHVPHSRRARPRESRGVTRSARRDRHPRAQPRRKVRRRSRRCSTGSCGAPRQRRRPLSSTSWFSVARRKPPTAQTISVISAWLCGGMPISPRRSVATPTCSCIVH